MTSMNKKQILSIDLLGLEDGVAKKFNSCKQIKTVWKYTSKLTNNYFSPLATLCFVLSVGAKKQITINQIELSKIMTDWKFEPTISFVEENILSQYTKYLDKIGFKIPQSNTSMPFKLKPRKVIHFQGKPIERKLTKKENADNQMKLGF